MPSGDLHTMKNKFFIVCICFLFPCLAWGQEAICIGTQHTLFSQVLQEERTYWVHVPADYDRDSTRTYPVIYLLDGDSFFHSLVGINQAFSKGRRKDLSPFIIVGVLNANRTRDLTPTASAAGRDGKIPPGAIPKGGGADAFRQYLVGELRTVIDSVYRTNDQHVLIGHSFGGLFTMHTFLNYTDAFDTYVAIDPSFWWDQGRLSKEAELVIGEKDFTGTRLYVAVATGKRPDRPSIHLSEAEHLLSDLLPQAKGLRFIKKSFPDEVHGTIPIPGIYDGIRQLFW